MQKTSAFEAQKKTARLSCLGIEEIFETLARQRQIKGTKSLSWQLQNQKGRNLQGVFNLFHTYEWLSFLSKAFSLDKFPIYVSPIQKYDPEETHFLHWRFYMKCSTLKDWERAHNILSKGSRRDKWETIEIEIST